VKDGRDESVREEKRRDEGRNEVPLEKKANHHQPNPLEPSTTTGSKVAAATEPMCVYAH